MYVHNLMTLLGNMEAITLGSSYKAHESPLSDSSMWQEIGKPVFSNTVLNEQIVVAKAS